MATLDRIIEGQKRKFDALRKVFFPEGATLEILEVDAGENDFNVLLTIETGWYLEFKEYRNQFKLQIAGQTDALAAAIKGGSHVRTCGELYAIEQADTVPPMGTEPVWKLYCGKGFKKSSFRKPY